MTDLDPTLVLAKQIASRIPRAVRNAADGRDGYPTGSSGSGGTSDRTGTLATKHVDRPDRAAADHAEMGRLIRRLASLVDSWAPNNAAADHLATQVEGPEGCRSCRRYKPDGRPAWSDIHRNGLCQWCIRATARIAGRYEWDDDMPPLGAVEHHHRTGKHLTDSVIDRIMHGRKRRDA